MTRQDETDEGDPGARPRPALLAAFGLTGVGSCTLYPPGDAVPGKTGAWIRAEGESFCSLAERR